MAQVLTSAEAETEVSRIQELSVVVSGSESRPRGTCGQENRSCSLW